MRSRKGTVCGSYGAKTARLARMTLYALSVASALVVSDSGANDTVPDAPMAGEEKNKTGGVDSAITFDNDFLSMVDGKAADHVDLNYFAHRGGMMPGDYTVQVKVNDRVVEDAKTITFRSWPDSPGKLYACVSANMLTGWGVKVTSPSGKGGGEGKNTSNAGMDREKGAADEKSVGGEKDGSAFCPVGGIVAFVPWGRESFDYNKHLLSITVPQAALGPASMLRTASSRWDEGIPAFLMNYNYSGSRQSGDGREAGSDYLGLNGQLNVLGWRVRSGLNGYRAKDRGQQWSAQDVYAQHDYAALRGGQLSVGKLTSDGSMVDSVSFVGMKMESDSGMLASAFTGYKPAITGMANTPATITVRQYGKVIYQKNVPQGPFSLTDFNRSGNGDVDVEIREADGSVRHFSMSSVVAPSLMAKGALGYSVSTGKFRNGNGYFSPGFAQGNLSYGVGANTSLLAGMIVSDDYMAMSGGSGVYSPMLGAFSLIGAFSTAQLSSLPGAHGRLSGMSGQLSWSRNIAGTALGFAATRYASKNFRSFSDIQQMQPREEREGSAQRATYSLSLSRSFDGFGSLSLAANQTEYWGRGSTQRGYTLSYNTSVHDVGVGISAGYNSYGGSSDTPGMVKNNKSISVNLSLPLGKWLPGGDANVNGTYMYSDTGERATQQAGVSGSVMNGRAGYSVSQGWGDSDSRNASLNYSARYASFNSGYSVWGSSRSWTYGMSGAVLVHPHGVTLSKQLALDGANALIEVPGIGGVRVGSVETDWRGFAVISGLTPYDLNRMNVDTASLPGNVEIDSSSKNTVPTRGSVVRVKFVGSQGYRILFELSRAAGGSIPFGAVVALKQKPYDADGGMPHTGIVGDNGRAYLSGLPGKGKLLVTWAKGDNNRCTADYQVPAGIDIQQLNQLTATCR